MRAPTFSEPIQNARRLSWRELLRFDAGFFRWSDTEQKAAGPLWRRWRTILLLSAGVALLLQANFIGLSIPTVGHQATTLPLHLQSGLLLAIAIVYRDRRIVAACFLLSFFAWYARRYYHFALPAKGALAGLLLILLNIPLVWLCAKGMGARRHTVVCQGLAVCDVLRLGGLGLVLFPAGAVLTAMLLLPFFGVEVWPDPEMILRHALGRAFGVLIITFPVVVAWSERHNPSPQRPSHAHVLKLFYILLGMGLFVALKHTVPVLTDGAHIGLQLTALEAVVIMVLLLGWCVLYLSPAWAVSVASVLMLTVFVFARLHYAEIGFSNLFSLLVIVYELAALQLAFICLVVVTRDARRAHMRLQARSQYDPLTGLPNLEALRATLGAMACQSQPRPSSLACLLVDAVGMASHTRTEQMHVASTQAVAASLADLVQVFLIGAHQYALLPRDAASTRVWTEVVARIERGEARSEHDASQLLAYVGVAHLDGGSPDALDDAWLAASKHASAARRQGELAPRFSHAHGHSDWGAFDVCQPDPVEVFTCLRGGHMALYFQSIHSLRAAPNEGVGISGEILCRMRTADGRMLMPATFTPLLEAAGRGAELDLAVVSAVVCMLQQHEVAPTHFRRLSLNLSGQGLASRSFHAQLWQVLAHSPIPLACFCFEITETAAIRNANAARELLAQLRAAGCQVAIDDFGTGLQTLERLKEFPVDVIKIDGSFVRGVVPRGNDYALVHACVCIAKAFGAETVAEYVEDEAIAQVLRELDVDWGQGYFFSEPQPFAEVLP